MLSSKVICSLYRRESSQKLMNLFCTLEPLVLKTSPLVVLTFSVLLAALSLLICIYWEMSQISRSKVEVITDCISDLDLSPRLSLL